MDSQDSKAAHTAEHAFIGSLQKILGHTLKVRKVSHNPSSGASTAFIVIPRMDIDLVYKAETDVNTLISQGRKIAARTFGSLAEAKAQVPNLRANEERIDGAVRVVEIEGHDVAACAMEHAENLSDCDFFLVTRLSKSGDEYEVDFVVGRKAKETATDLSVKLIKVCGEAGANINTIENTVKKLKAENESLSRKARFLTMEMLRGIIPEQSRDIKLYKGVFHDLLDDEIAVFAGQKILNENAFVAILNIAGGSDMANILLARNEKMPESPDCNKLFRAAAGQSGRGGGKSHFVRGTVDALESENILAKLSEQISRI